MKTILPLLLMLYGTLGMAQAPEIEWSKTYGGSEMDVGQSISKTADGGYIVSGESQSSNGDVSMNHGDAEYWLLKLDASGALEWEQSYGGSSYAGAIGAQQNSGGGFIVGGTYSCSNGDVTGHHGPNIGDYWVLKLDASGAIEWEKSLGGSMDDIAFDIRVTADDGAIIVGGS